MRLKPNLHQKWKWLWLLHSNQFQCINEKSDMNDKHITFFIPKSLEINKNLYIFAYMIYFMLNFKPNKL